jgi:hypothetical protein
MGSRLGASWNSSASACLGRPADGGVWGSDRGLLAEQGSSGSQGEVEGVTDHAARKPHEVGSRFERAEGVCCIESGMCIPVVARQSTHDGYATREAVKVIAGRPSMVRDWTGICRRAFCWRALHCITCLQHVTAVSHGSATNPELTFHQADLTPPTTVPAVLTLVYADAAGGCCATC